VSFKTIIVDNKIQVKKQYDYRQPESEKEKERDKEYERLKKTKLLHKKIEKDMESKTNMGVSERGK
jgi:hypothetical protein